MGKILDLFGDPIADNHGERGRPPHMPTAQNRNRVSLLVARGWSNERIAGAMLITLPTLRKYYFSELNRRAIERDRVEARLGMKLWEQVEAGNVGAMREMRKLLDRDFLMEFGQAQTAPGDEKPEADAGEKLGKKDAARLAAQTPDAGSPLGELMMRRQQATRSLNS